MLLKQIPLAEEIVLLGALWVFKERGELGLDPCMAPTFGVENESGQVDDQRCRKQTVATLPNELKDHLGAKETLKVDMVPSGFPIV